MAQNSPSLEGHRAADDEFSPENYEYVTSFDNYLLQSSSDHVRSNFDESVLNFADPGEEQKARKWARKIEGRPTHCSHCGQFLRYSAVMEHKPTGDFIGIGHDCLDNRFNKSEVEFNLDRLKEHQQRMKTLAENSEYREEFAKKYPDVYEFFQKVRERDGTDQGWPGSVGWGEPYDDGLAPLAICKPTSLFFSSDPQRVEAWDKVELIQNWFEFRETEEYELLVPDYPDDDINRGACQKAGYDLDILHSFARQYWDYGNLSEKQRNVLSDILEEQKSSDDEEAVPVPEGDGVEITGKIISTDKKENNYGTRLVMTIENEDGWRVWGSIPKALTHYDALKAVCETCKEEADVPSHMKERYTVAKEWREMSEEEVRQKAEDHEHDDITFETVEKVRPYDTVEGYEVKFVANVEQSDDEDFGFFKRPRKVEILDKGAEE